MLIQKCHLPPRNFIDCLRMVLFATGMTSVSEDLIAILLSSVLVGAGIVVARFFREASLLAATFLVGFIGLELALVLIS